MPSIAAIGGTITLGVICSPVNMVLVAKSNALVLKVVACLIKLHKQGG